MSPNPQVPSHRWWVLPEVYEGGHPWDPHRRQWFLQQHDWHGFSQRDPGMRYSEMFTQYIYSSVFLFGHLHMWSVKCWKLRSSIFRWLTHNGSLLCLFLGLKLELGVYVYMRQRQSISSDILLPSSFTNNIKGWMEMLAWMTGLCHLWVRQRVNGCCIHDYL